MRSVRSMRGDLFPVVEGGMPWPGARMQKEKKPGGPAARVCSAALNPGREIFGRRESDLVTVTVTMTVR